MGAVVRGRAPSRTRAQARAKVVRPAQPGRARKAPKPYQPAKLSAAQSFGLAPLTAVTLAGVLVLGGVAAALISDPRVQRLRAQTVSGIDQGLIGLGFKVSTVTVEGATPDAAAAVERAAGLSKGLPILHLDLAALRGRVEQVGWVKSAKVVRMLPDTVVIAIAQRQTLAVWQHDGRNLVIDSEGRGIPEADPGRFPDLPLVVGAGADKAAPAILPLLQARPRLIAKLDAIVRVDDRRWDLRTKDGGLIQLPATGEAAALEQLDRLDAESRILDLGLARIDLRDPELIAVRPHDAPTAVPTQAPKGA